MSAGHWNRRQFVGVALSTSVITIGGSVVPAFGATESIRRFAIVQSTALPIDSARIKDDLARNLTRILQIIEHHAEPHDWLAFDDAPLTGHAASVLPATDVSLGDEDLEKLLSAARHHHCWISLGAVRQARDSILVLSPTGDQQEWPMPPRHAPLPLIERVLEESNVPPIVTLNEQRIALVPIDARAEVIAECAERKVDIMITMGSGAGCIAPQTTHAAPSLLIQVHAAAPWQPPGCHTEGISRSRAFDARGTVLAECPSPGEHVLVLAGI